MFKLTKNRSKAVVAGALLTGLVAAAAVLVVELIGASAARPTAAIIGGLVGIAVGASAVNRTT
ncbi:MAG: hypothetical protein AAFR38_07515 [Planctomycetota bacterium]